jgi:steroid 5-alpha reductase family enzyme
MDPFWQLALTALVLVLGFLTGLYFFALKIRNVAVIDVFWGFGSGLLVLFYLSQLPEESAPFSRQLLITSIVLLHSLRLGTYLLQRFLKEHPTEDPRYAAMRDIWKTRPNLMFYLVYLLQGVLLVSISLPYLVILLNPAPEILWLEWLGLGIWLIGFIGEALADEQLKRFKSNPDNKGKICETGLWYTSRHPNYFFEWLMWVAYFIIAVGSPGGKWTIYAPLVMLHFLLNVTGVKASEEQSIKSKGEAYRRYQQTTSSFVPWFKKSTP